MNLRGIIHKTDKPQVKCQRIAHPRKEIFGTDHCYYPLLKALKEKKDQEASDES